MVRTATPIRILVRVVCSMFLAVQVILIGPSASAMVAEGPPSAAFDNPTAAVDPPIFSDDFSTGDFSNWTARSSRLAIDSTNGSPASPSARAQVNNQSAWAYRILDLTYSSACMSVNVNLVSGVGVYLFSMRSDENELIAGVQVNADGVLQVRSLSKVGKGNVPLGSGWHNVELCVSTGSNIDFTPYLDGRALFASGTNRSTPPIGRIQIGDTSSSTTFDVNFDDVELDQVAGDNDPGPDVTPPTVPGKPSGTIVPPSSIQITWAASTDDQIPPVRYSIYRDGELIIGATEATTFTDPWVVPGSTHTYFVVAFDVEENQSTSPTSDPITVPEAPPSFMDDFSSGGFANWTSVTRLMIDNSMGSPAAPSARAQVSNQRAFAYRTLDTPVMGGCLSANVNLISGLGVDLFRLRTAADGPIVRVFVNASGYLRARADLTGGTSYSNEPLGTGWHNVELCGAIGSNNVWNVYLDGVRTVIQSMDTGSTPIGRIQIGDTAAKTFTVNFDDVVLDQAPG